MHPPPLFSRSRYRELLIERRDLLRVTPVTKPVDNGRNDNNGNNYIIIIYPFPLSAVN